VCLYCLKFRLRDYCRSFWIKFQSRCDDSVENCNATLIRDLILISINLVSLPSRVQQWRHHLIQSEYLIRFNKGHWETWKRADRVLQHREKAPLRNLDRKMQFKVCYFILRSEECLSVSYLRFHRSRSSIPIVGDYATVSFNYLGDDGGRLIKGS
jgi:hypothetical protein